MPSIIFWGLSLCSMIVRVIPTEETGVDRNRTKQPMQTIIVQSKLDFGSIESRLLKSVESRISNLESEVKSGVAEVKSGMNSAVADMKSLFAKFVGNANGGNGSLTVGRNKTSNNVEVANEIEKKKSCANEDSCYQVFGKKKGEKERRWEDARRACRALGEDLVTIASPEEQINLVRHLKNTFPDSHITFWIGSKKGKGHPRGRFNWRWITGEPVSNDLFWNRVFMHEYDAACLNLKIWPEVSDGGVLYSEDCIYSNPYLCTKKN